MKKLRMFKMVRRSSQFNLNQKVWIVFESGALASLVVGRYRGKGRYIAAWVRYGRKNDSVPRFVECEVADSFAEKIDRIGWDKKEDEP